MTAVSEISNLVSQSNVEQSERSSSVPITSNRPIRKRVKRADRRERLESFVKKYRSLNLGKFPSPTSTQREIGGSYYSIKKMLQEIEYIEKGSTKENKKQITCDGALIPDTDIESSGSKEKSNDGITINQNFCEAPGLESGSNFDKKTNFRDSNIARDDAFNIATENDEKQKQNPSNDNFAFRDSESKVEKQNDGRRNITRDKREEDTELRNTASLWGNLKSLANVFMNMWKK
ncbi:hypothetical protein R6Q57_029862 [Mikania cordata]